MLEGQRGCKDALRRVEKLLNEGHTWVVDADLKRYFDTIPHDPLIERVEAKISDGRVLTLMEAYTPSGYCPVSTPAASMWISDIPSVCRSWTGNVARAQDTGS